MNVSTYNVLDTVAASGADITLSNHVLKFTGSPSIDFRSIESCQVSEAKNELLQITTITPTAADSKTFAFWITQKLASGGVSRVLVTYDTAASGDTATTICNAWRAQINLMSNLSVSVSGTSTLIITALTGAPIFTVTSAGNGTISAANTVSGKSTKTITALTAATGTFTASAHGYSVGDTVTVTPGGTSTLAKDGVSGLTSVTGVVKIAATNTFVLYGVTISADESSLTGTAVPQPSPAVGKGSDLIAAGVSTATAGNNYYAVKVNHLDRANNPGSTTGERRAKSHTVYVNTGDSDTLAASGFMDVLLLKMGAVTSGTTANAEAVSIL